MKYIKISRTVLQANLVNAAKYASKNTDICIEGVTKTLTVLHLDFSVNLLEIWARNYAADILLKMPIDNTESASFTLQANVLIDTVSRSEEDYIELAIGDDHLVLKTSSGKTTLKNLGDIGESPRQTIPTHSTETTGTDFASAFSMVSYAALRTENWPSLTGVRVEWTGDNGDVTLIATDSLRMATYSANLGTNPISNPDLADGITLPIKAVNQMIATLGKVTSNLAIGVDQGRFAISWESGYLSTCLVLDKFPDWKQLLPKTNKTTVTFKEGFLNAWKAAKVLAQGSVHPYPVVEIEVTADKTIFRSWSDLGKSEISLTPTIEGNTLEISFNGDLLPDLAFSDMKVEFDTKLKPALFTSQSFPGWSMVIMPLMVQKQSTPAS